MKVEKPTIGTKPIEQMSFAELDEHLKRLLRARKIEIETDMMKKRAYDEYRFNVATVEKNNKLLGGEQLMKLLDELNPPDGSR